MALLTLNLTICVCIPANTLLQACTPTQAQTTGISGLVGVEGYYYSLYASNVSIMGASSLAMVIGKYGQHRNLSNGVTGILVFLKEALYT